MYKYIQWYTQIYEIDSRVWIIPALQRYISLKNS